MNKYILEILSATSDTIREVQASKFEIENNRINFYKTNGFLGGSSVIDYKLIASYPEDSTIIKDIQDLGD